MNSEKLKIKFKDEYETFFKENSKIFSLPLILNWASDLNGQYKWVHIKQKIPLRIYLWINIIKENKIRFNKINYFDINEDIFLSGKLIEYSPIINEIKDIFNQELEANKKFNNWIEFNVLAETWKWQWMGFISILSALFIIWYKENYKEIYKNLEEILKEKWDNTIMSYLNKKTFYDDILRTTLKLNKKMSRPISTISQTASLFNWAYPIVSFIQKNYKTIEPDKITLFWYKLNSLSDNLPKIPYIPIDYGLIYTGMPVSASQILYSNNYTENKENNVLNNIIDFFSKDIDPLSNEDKPLFCDKFINNKSMDEKKIAFINIYLDLMWALSLKILNNLVKIYENPYDDYLSEKVLENIKKITHFNLLTKKCSTHFKKFIWEMNSNFKNSYQDLSIAPNDTMLMWWNAIFTMKFEWNRWKLLSTISDINKKYNDWIKLVYSNWLDWIEKEWLKIEQDLENKIYSDFINANSLVLINSNWEKQIIENDFLENNQTKNWLFLDLTKNKIYLNWNKLTSKELKSQNTTIELLLKLLENNSKFISNNELSVSSYSTNKNDMLSKIISPLQKLIKKENNIDFKITLTGSYSDFKIKLEENILQINIVRYII